MREVTKDEFFKAMGPLDVTPCPQGNWPYTSLFKTRSGQVRGVIEKFLPEGSGLEQSRYLLPL